MVQNPRIQYSSYNQHYNVDLINQRMIHANIRLIEMEKKQEAFEASVKRYAIAGILGLAAAILLYQNADSIRPKLQSLGTLTTADVQKAASDAWKDTTVQFGKATAYLSSLLN